MAGDNVLGTVSIVISGDTSRLQADFARAQAIAITSGAQVSAAFNQSAAGADRVVVAIGKLAGIIQQESAAASLAAQRNLALAVSFQQTQVAAGNTARAVTAAGNAHTAVVPQMAAVSGAIRTAFGEQSIRAVERFLTLIPGVGAALQAAFPIIGALALFEMLARLVSKSDDLKKAQEDLKGAVKETDDSYAHLVTTLDQLGAKQIGRDLGAAAEARARATLLRNEAGDLQKQVLAKQTEINQLRIPRQGRGDIIEHPIGTFTGSLAKETEVQVQTVEKQIEKLQNEIDGKLAEARDAVGQYGKLAAEQAGALAAAQLSNRQKSLAAETDAFRRALADQVVISHGAAQQQIAAISDVDTHELRSAQEAVRAAAEKQDGITAIERAELPKRIALINQEAAAEAAGKDEAARKRIFELARGKVDAARVESRDTELNAAHETLVAVTDLETKKGEIITRQANAAALAWDEAYSKIDDAATKAFDALNKAAEANALGRVKVIETGEKSTAATDELKIIQEKLRLEQQYSLQVGHTGAQQLAYASQIDAIEARARAAKITGLNAELQTAIANSKDVDADEKVATIREQIARLQGESDNAAIIAQTRRLELEQRISLEYRLRSAFVRAAQAVPGAVGGGLARGIVDGRGIGRDIRDELKGVGQQLLGNVFKDVAEKIGAEIIAHTILGAILIKVGILHQVAEDLNTKALLGLTVAIEKQAASSAIGGIGGAAGGAGGAAGAAASSAASGLIGPLIAAAGGIIGGVISGVLALHGAHLIVNAVNGTTAAVLSLRGNTSLGSNQTSNQPTLAQPSQNSSHGGIFESASQGGVFGFFASILGRGGAKPVDVNIVAISPLSPLKGLFNLFGFASGGRPPVGVASIVGENGPELWLPDQAGTIVPAGGFAPGIQQLRSGGGDNHFHGNMTFHGVQNVRQMMKEIATYAKTQSPSHSPYASK